MRVLHTSHEEISKINNSGIFGECLFFSVNEYFMTNRTHVTYELELDESKIIDVSCLDDDETIERIAQYFDISNEDAAEILTGEKSVFDLTDDYEADWWVQGVRGECAKKMGFDACADIDEQGTVYITPMLGRENDLKKVA